LSYGIAKDILILNILIYNIVIMAFMQIDIFQVAINAEYVII